MLSGFFGLIAIDTSAGLIAEGSVMRTTCCAEVIGKLSKKKHSAMNGSGKYLILAMDLHGLVYGFYFKINPYPIRVICGWFYSLRRLVSLRLRAATRRPHSDRA